MATLPELANFDAGRMIGFGEAGRKRRTLAELGGLAAQGDFKGAQAAAFQGGETEMGLALKQMNDQDQRQLIEDAGSGAYAANTPEAWERFRQSFIARGFDPGDFSQREAVYKQALGVKGQLDEAYRQAQLGMDRERLGLERQRVAQAGAGGGKFGMQPIWLQDEQGNWRVGQLGEGGQGAISQFPEGFQPAPPADIAQARSYGTQSGKISAEKPAEAAKAANLLGSLEYQWNLVGQEIDRAIQSIDEAWVPRTGLGAMAAAVPGTPQHDLSNLLDTIRANIGFDKLQEMRANSPTGGALGQVSNFENQLLQATKGSLQQGQSADQLKANLQRVKDILTQLQQDRRAAFQRDYGDVSGGGQPQAPANLIQPTGPGDDIDALIRQYAP